MLRQNLWLPCILTSLMCLTSCDEHSDEIIEPDKEVLVLALNGMSELEHTVQIMSITEEGQIIDNNLKFSLPDIPNAIAIRNDGQEVAITWGFTWREHGLLVLKIEPDGTAAQLHQELTMGIDATATGIAYLDDDTLVISYAGIGEDPVKILTRQSDDTFVLEESVVIGDSPDRIESVPGQDEVLMLKLDVLSLDSGCDVASIYYGTSWTVATPMAHIDTQSYDMKVHPNGEIAYLLTKNPEDVAGESNLNPTGLLHYVSRTAEHSWSFTTDSYVTPDRCYYMTLSPDGTFGVCKDEVIVKEDNSITTSGYSFVTFSLDSAGEVTTFHTETAFFSLYDVYSIEDFAIDKWQHLIISQWTDNLAPADEAFQLVVLESTNNDGNWQEIGTPTKVQGVALIGLRK